MRNFSKQEDLLAKKVTETENSVSFFRCTSFFEQQFLTLQAIAEKKQIFLRSCKGATSKTIKGAKEFTKKVAKSRKKTTGSLGRFSHHQLTKSIVTLLQNSGRTVSKLFMYYLEYGFSFIATLKENSGTSLN